MKRKLKSLIAVIAVFVLALSMNTFVFAADDIVLDGDGGASSLIGDFKASGGEYKYLGFATTKEATAEYTKLQLTYKGDISCLRIEFNRQEDDSNEGPYWFNQEQELHFIVSEGTLDLNPSDYNTVTFDLAAMGINIADFWGMHLHYLDPNMQEGSFSIKDARLIADGAEPAADETKVNEAGNDGNSSGDSSGSSSDSDKPAKSISASGGTEGTAGGSTSAAPSTGSVMWPILIACGGIVVAAAAFIGSKKLKEEQ